LYSLEGDIVHGIYGGTTPQDRRDRFGQRIARYRPRHLLTAEHSGDT
jgi:hypothetical protein